jgi:CheY-like chemotaxis protein
MRASNENTEVLLTDYLDGRLDPVRRAELEAYLSDNPRQKDVLDDLAAQREALRDLPPETAPNDLGDHVRDQLERSVLLGDFEDLDALPRSNPRFRSQVLAAAALLVLSAGLVTVIYEVVAPPTLREVASVQQRGTGGGGGAEPLDPATLERNVGAAANNVREANKSPIQEAGGRGQGLQDRGFEAQAAQGREDGAHQDGAHSGVAERGLFGGGAAMAPMARARATHDDGVVPGGSPAIGPPATTPRPADESLDGTPIRIILYADDVPAARARIQAFLRQGGWSVSDVPVAAPASGPAVGAATTQPAERSVDAGMRDLTLRGSGASAKATTKPTPPAAARLLVRVESDQAETLASILPKLAQPEPTTRSEVPPPATATMPSPLAYLAQVAPTTRQVVPLSPMTTLSIEIRLAPASTTRP